MSSFFCKNFFQLRSFVEIVFYRRVSETMFQNKKSLHDRCYLIYWSNYITNQNIIVGDWAGECKDYCVKLKYWPSKIYIS